MTDTVRAGRVHQWFSYVFFSFPSSLLTCTLHNTHTLLTTAKFKIQNDAKNERTKPTKPWGYMYIGCSHWSHWSLILEDCLAQPCFQIGSTEEAL
jgi:hypothetical protein